MICYSKSLHQPFCRYIKSVYTSSFFDCMASSSGCFRYATVKKNKTESNRRSKAGLDERGNTDSEGCCRESTKFQQYMLRRAWGLYYAVWSLAFVLWLAIPYSISILYPDAG